jgi:amidase
MNGSSLLVAVMLFALSAASGAPCHAQGRNDGFQPMETTIEDIHTAFKSGLTARRLVQAYLDRIAAYDKQGPTINSIITLNDHASRTPIGSMRPIRLRVRLGHCTAFQSW